MKKNLTKLVLNLTFSWKNTFRGTFWSLLSSCRRCNFFWFTWRCLFFINVMFLILYVCVWQFSYFSLITSLCSAISDFISLRIQVTKLQQIWFIATFFVDWSSNMGISLLIQPWANFNSFEFSLFPLLSTNFISLLSIESSEFYNDIHIDPSLQKCPTSFPILKTNYFNFHIKVCSISEMR